MQINASRVENGELILTVADVREAMRFCMSFAAGLYDIIKTKKKRSRDANAYCWVLIDKLSEALPATKGDVYRNAIRNIGGVSDVFSVRTEAVQKLCSGWERHGLGWQAEQFPSALDGHTNVVLYYGSSSYDTKQMSALIDSLVEDCRTLEIETLPPYKLAALLEGWDEKTNKSSGNQPKG